MTRDELFPPRTLADALTYYADSDFKNAINAAKAEGRLEAKREMASKMKSRGIATELITECVGLTVKEIEKL